MHLLGKLLSSWMRMGTYTRLFVPIFVIIAVVIGARYTLLIESESAAEGMRYRIEAQQLGQYLALALKPLDPDSDNAAIAALLSDTAARHPDLALAHWRHAEGETTLAGEPASIDYPAWLPPLVSVAPLYQRLRVPLRGGGSGTLTLWFQPAQALNRVWQALRRQAAISAFNVCVIYLLLGGLIWLNQRMLRVLANATGRFQAGEHAVRLPERGLPEARAMAVTFNAMASQVQALVQSLHQQKEKTEVTLASMGDAVITTTPGGRVETLNEAAEALTGHYQDQARGLDLHAVFTLAHGAGQQALARTMMAIHAGAPPVKARNQSLRHRDGQHFVVEYTAAAIRGSDAVAQGAVLVFRDVSEKKQLIQQMSWQSQHDVLTGLPNRAALASRLEHEIALVREEHSLLAVCMFDLDHFQQVNQHGGQALGDDVLKQLASRLHGAAAPRHYAARLGGDEFVLLLPEQCDRAGTERTLQELMALLARDFECAVQGGHTVSVTASAGVVFYTGADISADNLLRHADQALYQAKISGRSRIHYFDADLDEQVRTHHNRRSEVRAALQAGELCLYYQPKLDMRCGRIVGMEALLRWRHPLHGIIGPMAFLPVVEHTDLIIEIGEFVLRQALAQMEAWRASQPEWVVSVNIAARHFQRHDFVGRLTTILGEYPDVPARGLQLEILESSALHDVNHVRRIMLECQALGIRFALDDFGTGYSSLSYLKRLPADVLKIDQSFVRNMLVDSDDLHLVSAVIGLARAFNREVIAEGVESREHGAQLLRLGCGLAQGYGIARPMPAGDVLDWAARFAAAPAWQDTSAAPPVRLHDAAAAALQI